MLLISNPRHAKIGTYRHTCIFFNHKLVMSRSTETRSGIDVTFCDKVYVLLDMSSLKQTFYCLTFVPYLCIQIIVLVICSVLEPRMLLIGFIKNKVFVAQEIPIRKEVITTWCITQIRWDLFLVYEMIVLEVKRSGRKFQNTADH